MWTLLAQIPIARRKTLTHVLDDAGDLRWSGKTVGAALRWLHENEIHAVELLGTEDDWQFFVQFRPLDKAPAPGVTSALAPSDARKRERPP